MRAWWLSWTGHIILRTDWHSVFTNLNRGEPVWLVFFTYARLCKRETVSEERTVWRAFRRGSLPGKCDTWRNWREHIYILTTQKEWLLVCIFVKHFAYSSACVPLFPVNHCFLGANSTQSFLGTRQCLRDCSHTWTNGFAPFIFPRPLERQCCYQHFPDEGTDAERNETASLGSHRAQLSWKSSMEFQIWVHPPNIRTVFKFNDLPEVMQIIKQVRVH